MIGNCNSLHVLQLGKFYPIRGGVEKVMYEMTLGLAERVPRRVCSDMLCAFEQGGYRVLDLPGQARLIGCRTWKKVAATMIAPSMIGCLRRICRHYDIIHVHHPDPMACLALFLSGYRGQVVLHWHSDIQNQRWLLQLYRPLQSWLLRRANLILGTTPVYLRESPCLQQVQDKTRTLPIGVDPVCPDPQAVARIQARYPGKKLVFSLGRLVAYKGYRYLVEAAAYLSDDYVVLIGGSGALEGELRRQIAHLGLEKKVELLGRVSDEDLSAYYGAARVFCLSSVMKTEAFAIVQIEAMSCGTPVVATRIPQSGVSWVNRHGDSGLNVEPGSGQQLAEAIQTIGDDEAVYSKFCQRARKRYLDFFTKQRMISDLENIYWTLWEQKCNRNAYEKGNSESNR